MFGDAVHDALDAGQGVSNQTVYAQASYADDESDSLLTGFYACDGFSFSF